MPISVPKTFDCCFFQALLNPYAQSGGSVSQFTQSRLNLGLVKTALEQFLFGLERFADSAEAEKWLLTQ
jgi:hypothetical protein